jgi:hypothetical protein
MHAFCFYSQVLDGHSFLLSALGYGLWPGMVLLSEIVQTTILADFCYYYVKRYAPIYYTFDSVCTFFVIQSCKHIWDLDILTTF